MQPAARTASPDSAPGAEVDRKEGIEHVIFKGEKGKIKVKADRSYAGDDKLDHLEGNVEVVDYGRTGGQELTVTADKVDYDQDLTFFKVSGKAKVRDKDSVFRISVLRLRQDAADRPDRPGRRLHLGPARRPGARFRL